MAGVVKLKLVVDPTGRGSVLLDDTPLDCVTGIEIRCSAGELTQIKLTIFAELDAEVTATLENIALAKKEPEVQTVRTADGREFKVRAGAV